MTDNLSPEDRRKTMRAVKSQRTGPERRLFAMLAAMAIRGWRRNATDLPGKPDVVFPTHRLVVFVDGCFWHGCPVCRRRLPATNQPYWADKISRNISRDLRSRQLLRDSGWKVLRFWEHQLRNPRSRPAIRRAIIAQIDKGAAQQ